MPESPQREKNPPTDWKLKLRYGKLETPYSHYTLICDGVLLPTDYEVEGSSGPAVWALKVWAKDHQDAFDLAESLSSELNFRITGRTELYETEPEEPPHESRYGYDFRFTRYDPEALA